MLTLQGWFYLLTGIWPIVSMKTFQMVTGPKYDKWLVKTLGLLIACSGLTFLIAKDSPPLAIYFLAISQALSLALIDVWYVKRRIISKVYLLNAGLEVLIVGGHLWNIAKAS